MSGSGTIPDSYRMDDTLAYYEKNARQAATSYEGVAFDAPLNRLIQLVADGARILEIGTGSGRDAARLLSEGYRVDGIDGSSAMIAQAKALHPELSDRLTHHVLPEPLPYNSSEFDAVASWAVLMHLRAEFLAPVFGEIRRIVVPGGIFAYSVNTERPGLDLDGCDERGRHFTCLPVAGW